MRIRQNVTPRQLILRTVLYDLDCCMKGGTIMVIALICWMATFYISYELAGFLVRRFHRYGPTWPWETISATVTLGVPVFLGVFTFFQRSLFLSTQVESLLPHDLEFERLDPPPLSPGIFVLSILCIAGQLSFLGWFYLRRCYGFDWSRFVLAASIYVFLIQRGRWTPYPLLYSQRRAVALLYHLGMIRVSRRFGRIELKVIGINPQRV